MSSPRNFVFVEIGEIFNVYRAAKCNVLHNTRPFISLLDNNMGQVWTGDELSNFVWDIALEWAVNGDELSNFGWDIALEWAVNGDELSNFGWDIALEWAVNGDVTESTCVPPPRINK